MFLTLSEYLLGARKLLNLYGYNIHKNDEDAISFVASYMIKADQTWDGVSSNRDTWRFNRARYAIMKLKTKYRTRKRLVSLSTVVSKKGEKEIKLSDIVESRKDRDFIVPFNDIISRAKNILTPRQFDCIFFYYSDQLKMEEIGQRLGITKQAVSLHIKNAIKVLKDECRNKVDYITS